MGERYFRLFSIADIENTTQKPHAIQVMVPTEIPYATLITTFKAAQVVLSRIFSHGHLTKAALIIKRLTMLLPSVSLSFSRT